MSSPTDSSRTEYTKTDAHKVGALEETISYAARVLRQALDNTDPEMQKRGAAEVLRYLESAIEKHGILGASSSGMDEMGKLVEGLKAAIQ